MVPMYILIQCQLVCGAVCGVVQGGVVWCVVRVRARVCVACTCVYV